MGGAAPAMRAEAGYWGWDPDTAASHPRRIPPPRKRAAAHGVAVRGLAGRSWTQTTCVWPVCRKCVCGWCVCVCQ